MNLSLFLSSRYFRSVQSVPVLRIIAASICLYFIGSNLKQKRCSLFQSLTSLFFWQFRVRPSSLPIARKNILRSSPSIVHSLLIPALSFLPRDFESSISISVSTHSVICGKSRSQSFIKSPAMVNALPPKNGGRVYACRAAGFACAVQSFKLHSSYRPLSTFTHNQGRSVLSLGWLYCATR